jgi:hypothetical protein
MTVFVTGSGKLMAPELAFSNIQIDPMMDFDDPEDYIDDAHLQIKAFNMAPYRVPVIDDTEAVPIPGSFKKIGLKEGRLAKVYEKDHQLGYYEQAITEMINNNRSMNAVPANFIGMLRVDI